MNEQDMASNFKYEKIRFLSETVEKVNCPLKNLNNSTPNVSQKVLQNKPIILIRRNCVENNCQSSPAVSKDKENITPLQSKSIGYQVSGVKPLKIDKSEKKPLIVLDVKPNFSKVRKELNVNLNCNNQQNLQLQSSSTVLKQSKNIEDLKNQCTSTFELKKSSTLYKSSYISKKTVCENANNSSSKLNSFEPRESKKENLNYLNVKTDFKNPKTIIFNKNILPNTKTDEISISYNSNFNPSFANEVSSLSSRPVGSMNVVYTTPNNYLSTSPGFTPPQSQVFTHNVKHDRMALKHFQAPDKFYPNASFCHSPADDSLTNITWLGQMGVNNLMPLPIECDRKYLERAEQFGRPPYSYMVLIQFAINSNSSRRMTLRQIYQWIEDRFPYFKTAKPGWKNSIRHNLSLHDIFVREISSGSKASYWTLRDDLNVRPLTLENMRIASRSFFGVSGYQSPMMSLQAYSNEKRSIISNLPQCSQPYVLFPVSYMQSGNSCVEANKATLNSLSTSSSFGPKCDEIFPGENHIFEKDFDINENTLVRGKGPMFCSSSPDIVDTENTPLKSSLQEFHSIEEDENSFLLDSSISSILESFEPPFKSLLYDVNDNQKNKTDINPTVSEAGYSSRKRHKSPVDVDAKQTKRNYQSNENIKLSDDNNLNSMLRDLPDLSNFSTSDSFNENSYKKDDIYFANGLKMFSFDDMEKQDLFPMKSSSDIISDIDTSLLTNSSVSSLQHSQSEIDIYKTLLNDNLTSENLDFVSLGDDSKNSSMKTRNQLVNGLCHEDKEMYSQQSGNIDISSVSNDSSLVNDFNFNTSLNRSLNNVLDINDNVSDKCNLTTSNQLNLDWPDTTSMFPS